MIWSGGSGATLRTRTMGRHRSADAKLLRYASSRRATICRPCSGTANELYRSAIVKAMGAPDLSSSLMAQFRDSGAEKHTTLLLGAGASTTSGLPGWNDLVARLLTGSGAAPDEASARLLLSRQDPLIVAEAARARYGATWLDKVRNELYRVPTAPASSPLHLAVVSHALAGGAGDTSLVTLNFDTLIEQTLRREKSLDGDDKISVRSVSDTATTSGYGDVHHLHGVIDPSETRDVVFTLMDFLDVLSDPNSWQSTYLHSALGRGAVIIAGTSYRDPDMRQWLHSARVHAPDEHAALVILAREGFDLTREQFADLKVALEFQWSAVGLRPVLVDDHSDAAQAIRELRSVNMDGYLAPQQRAKLVWNHCHDQFSSLQPHFADLLKEDAERMKSAFDVDRLGMSLWLSNGDGSLARWAADDRTYRDPAGLRLVDTGFDSPWIAGRALSADGLLIQDIERSGTRRWRSVAAVPVPVEHPTHPTMSMAVITVGLPDEAEAYDGSSFLWTEKLSKTVDSWSTRLTEAVFGSDRATI